MKKGDTVKISTFVLAVALTLTVLTNAPLVQAQVSETDQLQQLRAEVQADRQAVVAEVLGLTDAEGQAFWPLYREYRTEMAKVGDRIQKVIQEFARVYESATNEQAKGMVDEMMLSAREELKIKEAYLPKFRKVLPEVKVARLLQTENKIDALIRFDLATSIPMIQEAK